MAQNVNPRPSGTTTFDKDAADRGSSTSSAQVSQKIKSFGSRNWNKYDFPH